MTDPRGLSLSDADLLIGQSYKKMYTVGAGRKSVLSPQKALFIRGDAMAETTKLAGTFTAWRYTMAVRLNNWIAASQHCRKLGLDPRLCGDRDEKFLFQVLIPVGGEGCFQKEMQPFGATLIHGTKVELVCPVQ